MEWDLDQRRVTLSAGEFADFTLGPRSSDGGPRGLWRAQLGTYWHQQLRILSSTTQGARFEVPLDGELFHRGWIIAFNGRIDQILPTSDSFILREIKTVTCALPAPEEQLRADYPSYFLQLGVYAALLRLGRLSLSLIETGGVGPPDAATPPAAFTPELYFIEASSGLAQSVLLSPDDERLFSAQLERIVEFLELRLRSRERLSQLRIHAPFAQPRPGQESTHLHLSSALRSSAIVCFEAPTGFGKTGLMLQAGLELLQQGRADRLLYLTSKSTGQLQVRHTLDRMTAPHAGLSGATLASWVVRPKSEHCINSVFRCTPDFCPNLVAIEQRWPGSGLSRFYTLPEHPRDLASLRAAGSAVSLCPYEITRAALPFNEVWIGDFNYVFSPSARGFFFEQPGFDPARTVLVVDEAHNLPARVADALSHAFDASAARDAVSALTRIRAPSALVRAFDNWAFFLATLRPKDSLPLADEEDALQLAHDVSRALQESPVDLSNLEAPVLDVLWSLPWFVSSLEGPSFSRLWWCAREGELLVTSLDPAPAIGPTLRSFHRVLLASATFGPLPDYFHACGIDEANTKDLVTPAPFAPRNSPSDPTDKPALPDRFGSLTKKATRKVFKNLVSGAALLEAAAARDTLAAHLVRAETPWREGAYDVAIDTRVDTRYAQRVAGLPYTAQTLISLAHHAPADRPAVVAFFPSYAYAEAVREALLAESPAGRVVLQPRASQLKDASEWIESALPSADYLFLILGSSLAESIDLLGGRIAYALVAGPALPEVNPVQKAKLAPQPGESRDDAFRRVYQIPGMQRVNQALGRLVRAPGQTCRIVLHCRRFAEGSYRSLLASEYQNATVCADDESLAGWLGDYPKSPLGNS